MDTFTALQLLSSFVRKQLEAVSKSSALITMDHQGPSGSTALGYAAAPFRSHSKGIGQTS
jgi:hypothetical protein